jgi:hypothetical protein
MTEDGFGALARCQAGLFSALVGVLVGKGIVTREEVVVALNVVEEEESELFVKMIYRVLSEVILQAPIAPAPADFKPRLIVGGLSVVGDGAEH